MATKLQHTIEHEGKQVPICDLETINFERLLSQEPSEVQMLLACCQVAGFFYLNLRDIDGRGMLVNLQRLLVLMLRFFNAPHKDKNEIGLPSQEHGYEPIGNHAGLLDSTKDGYEIFKVSRDEISKTSPNLPFIVNNKGDIETLLSFIAGSNIITKTILSCLSTALGLTGAARLEYSHRNEHKSNSSLAMFRYIPGSLTTSKEIGHQKHTDIGSLTLLFSEQWGLQVLPPQSSTWAFVEPRPGHAVINVGDSLRFASEHMLYSCVHRVVPFNTADDRYSIAYFLRPENDAKFLDSQGRWVTASQWHDEKYDVFKVSHGQHSPADAILLGGMA